MKTMKPLKQLNNFLKIAILFLGCLFWQPNETLANTKWEVAVLFLGANENESFQAEVNQNLSEISQINDRENIKISTYRESPGKYYSQEQRLRFLKNSFKSTKSSKALIIYGHGEGPSGLRDLPTVELKNLLDDLKIKFDLLWFDSCFLSNLEFLFELRNYSHYTMASEEAEFSAGLPFESLSEITNLASAKEAAIYLAKRFIDSYSFLKNGNQNNAVISSSATISVIENSEIESFVRSFQDVSRWISNLSVIDQKRLKNRLLKKFSMDKKDLVDLGHMLIELRLINKDVKIDERLTQLIRLLQIESIKRLRTNPRLKITPPEPNALMVYGFNNWEQGFKDEYLSNEIFMKILKTTEFVPGPKENYWPVKRLINQKIFISPFAPGINTFNYYFLDSTGNRLLSDSLSFSRTVDVIESSAQEEATGAFLVYNAYTQQVGSNAEKYTGVNLTIFHSIPDLDYYELEFNQITQWLKL